MTLFSKPEAEALVPLPLHGLTYGARGAGLLGDLPLVRFRPGDLVHEPWGTEVHDDGRLGRRRMRGVDLGEQVVVVFSFRRDDEARLLYSGAAHAWALGGGQERAHGAGVGVRATGG